MEKKAKLQRELLFSTFKEKEFALKFDGWTSVEGSKFIGLSCHWVDESFVLHRCLADIFHSQTQTAVNIANGIREMVESRGINIRQAIFITTDNGTNMKAAIRELRPELPVPSLSCFAHTLNLIVQKNVIGFILLKGQKMNTTRLFN